MKDAYELIANGELPLALSSSQRDNISYAICAHKREGKTTIVRAIIVDYRRKYPKRPIVVFDYSNAFGDSMLPDGKGGFIKGLGYERWTLDELLNGKWFKDKVTGKKVRMKWSPHKLNSAGYAGIIRVTDYESKEQVKAVFDYISNGIRNAAIFIDEAAVIFPQTAQEEHKGLLIKHTNTKNDLFCIFHGVKNVPIKLRQHFWAYILFHCPETYTSAKQIEDDEFPDPVRFFERFDNAQKFPKDRALHKPFDMFFLDSQCEAEKMRVKHNNYFLKLAGKIK